MKTLVKLLVVTALLMAGQYGHAQQRDTVIIHDTIYIEKPKKKVETVKSADLIRLKPFGRYDRGIVNYKFLPKGKWIGGLTFSYMTLDSDDSSMLYSLLGDMNTNFAVKTINPYIGYTIRDNMVIGAKFGYNHLTGDIGNLNLDLGSDLNLSLSDMRYIEDLYSFGIFHRSYIGLDGKGIFGLFNETSLTYKHGSSSFASDQKTDQPKRTETTINELHLGINPGVAVYITKNVCAEMSFGVAGFKYRAEKQRNEMGEEGSRSTSGANFKINILNINIGITLCL